MNNKTIIVVVIIILVGVIFWFAKQPAVETNTSPDLISDTTTAINSDLDLINVDPGIDSSLDAIDAELNTL